MTRLCTWQCVVFAVLWLAYGSTYLLRKPIGVIKADLQAGLSVPSASLGWVDTALLLPYAVVSLLLGSLGDQLGPRLTLAGGLLVAAAATVPMAWCDSLPPLLVLLCLSGAGQALCWPAACSLLARWFSDTSRNSVFGWFGTTCFVGGLAGTGLTVYLQAQYGWRHVFLPPALVVAGLAVLVLVTGKTPEDLCIIVPDRAANQRKDDTASRVSLGTIWGMAMVPEVSVAMFCVKSVRYALMFWLPLYLLRSLGYSQTTAGLVSTAFEVGGMVGSAGVGVVVDRVMGGRGLLACGIAVVGSALALVVFLVTSSYGTVFHVVCLTLAGAFNCGPDVLLAGSVAADIGHREGGAASAVTGFVNGMGSLGTVLEGPIVAWAAAAWGWNSLIPIMVAMTCVGAFAAFKANTVHQRINGRVRLEATVA